jgi:hypothetical protein
MEIKIFLLIIILVQIIENCCLSARIGELEENYNKILRRVKK